MSKTKFLKGECQQCGGHLEFPAEMAGMASECPHCRQPTDLVLVTPPEEPAVPRGTVVWAVLGIVILSLGLAGALMALKRAERLAAKQKARANEGAMVESTTNLSSTPAPHVDGAAAKSSFTVSPVVLETTPGTSRIDATGVVTNSSDQKRFGVKVEVDLFDATDQKVGIASDYQSVMEPGAEWRFKALVLDPKATSAKIASIKEDQ